MIFGDGQYNDARTSEISKSLTITPDNQVIGSASPKAMLEKGRLDTDNSKPCIQTDIASVPDNALFSLPTEVLEMIVEAIHGHLPTLGALSRTCRRLYSLAVSRVHKRVLVLDAAPCWSDAVLRCLQPYLSVKQKRELMNEYPSYKRLDQGDMFTMDETTTLDLAVFVREIIIDTDDLPGRKTRPVVESCLAKALANMKNLESLETKIMTGSISGSLHALAKLKRVRIMSQNLDDTDTKPLTGIKNLNHFCFENCRLDIEDRQFADSIQAILENSSTTLESLELRNINIPLESLIPKHQPLDAPSYRLHDLHSLSLHGIDFDQTFVESLAKVVDLARLRNLQLAPTMNDEDLLYRHMTELNISAKKLNTSIKLQQLSIRIPGDLTWPGDRFETICHFISSFDTLRDLEISYFDLLRSFPDRGDGVWDMLIPAIAKHKTLQTLKLWFEMQTENMPAMSAAHIAALVGQLPRLETIVLIPDESNFEETGEAFSHGPSLENIYLCPVLAGLGPVETLERKRRLMSAIVQGYLSRTSGTNGDFVWEQHFNLQRIRINYTTWTISPHLASLPKRLGNPVDMTSSDGKKHVFCCERMDQGGTSQSVGYCDHFQWVMEQDEISNPFRRLLF